MNRAAILARASALVTGDRARDYGDAHANFDRVARLWSALLGVRVSATDVTLMMALLKIARAKNAPLLLDSWIDGCGYLGLGGEIAQRWRRRRRRRRKARREGM